MPIRSRRQGQEWARQGLSLRTPCTLSFPVHTRIITSETTSHKPATNVVWIKKWVTVFTFWKWPTWLVESTRWAAFPKKVCTPVAITTASISPCLHVEPENTSSPGFLSAGIDSPVKIDCKITFELRVEQQRELHHNIAKEELLLIFSSTYLVNLQRISIKESSISRNDVTQFDTDDIPWYQHICILLWPSCISQHLPSSMQIPTRLSESLIHSLNPWILSWSK